MYELFCSSNDIYCIFRANTKVFEGILSFEYKSSPFACKDYFVVMCKFAIVEVEINNLIILIHYLKHLSYEKVIT